MKHITIRLLAAVLTITPVMTWAAKAPLSPEGLKKAADHIVSGTVVEVTSKTQKSRIEKAWGVHRDRVFTITLKANKVVKGTAIKAGRTIEIKAWQPAKRIPPLPGLQGHGTLPQKGDAVTVYLKGKDGNAFTPILPNGIEVQKKTD